jgi:protein TonB
MFIRQRFGGRHQTVARAAPFPPIPAEAGRSTWAFTVPLTFRR